MKINEYAIKICDDLFSEINEYESILDNAANKIINEPYDVQYEFWILLESEVKKPRSVAGLENYGSSLFNKQVEASKKKIAQAIALKKALKENNK